MSTSQKILLVDDDPDILDLLEYNLKKEGYLIETANNGLEAIAQMEKYKPKLIIMDIMMPKMDGIEAATRIRKMKGYESILIIFLTARSEEYSEVAAFAIGAIDYIVKPIKINALISRIKAILGRSNSGITLEPDGDEKISIGSIIINKKNHSVIVNNEPVVLPKKEFELLYFFMQNEGKVFTRESILSKIWGEDITVIERTVDVHIRKIREKIGENFIKTLKGVGYMFVNE